MKLLSNIKNPRPLAEETLNQLISFDSEEFLMPQKVRDLPLLAKFYVGPANVQVEFIALAIDYLESNDIVEIRNGYKCNVGPVMLMSRVQYALLPLIRRSLPVPVELAERFFDRWRKKHYLREVTPGSVLNLIECAAQNQKITTKFLNKLRTWRKDFQPNYFSNAVSARPRLDKLIAKHSPRQKRPAPPRAIHDWDGLVRALRDSSIDIRAGRPRTCHIDSELLKTINSDDALLVLCRCAVALEMQSHKGRDHLGRYAADRRGFGGVKKLAPALCKAISLLATEAATKRDQYWSQIAAEMHERAGLVADESVRVLFKAMDKECASWGRPIALHRIMECFWLRNEPMPLTYAAFRKTIERINLGSESPATGEMFEALEDEADRGDPLTILPGDAWTDRFHEDLLQMPEDQRQHWLDLLNHCGWTDWAKPTKKWLSQAARLVTPLSDEFSERFTTYLNHFGTRGSRKKNLWGWPEDPTIGRGANNRTLRGLIWASLTPQANPTRELCSAIAAAGIAGDKKVIRLGPRCIIVRNAAIEALAGSTCEFAAPCLGVIDFMMKYKAGRKRSATAVKRLAAEQGLTRDQFIERTVPTYDFDTAGTKTITFNNSPLTLSLVPPGEVRGDESFKTKPPESREIRRVLAAHKLRLERLLATTSSWPMSDWRKWYGDHPLLAPIASRLIWRVEDRGGIYQDSRWIDERGRSITFTPKTLIRPWHPATATAKEVVAWRTLLEKSNVKQPFAQSHRHIYILTPAESGPTNQTQRFMSHVLHATKFRALLRERMWEGDPVITFDTSNSPAMLVLEHADLIATFQTMPLDLDEDSGFYTRIATGALAFARISDGSAIQLSTIPPAVFSEVLRDVDLFISTCSVGLDPLWLDAHGRNEYAWDFAFGALAPSAAARRDVLTTLLPRLKISKVCTLADRFLQVQGKLRTYRIHLGSANIMMAPNDEYLCIVPARGQTDFFDLPFDGDPLLSIILSKAFMLAADDQITDPSIRSQIMKR